MDNTREKLIKLLSAVSCNGNGESLGSCPDRKYGLCGEMANLSYCVIQNTANYLIAHGVTVQKWIPVTERLPERFVYVLVMTDFGEAAVARIKGNGYWYIGWDND